MEPLLGGSVIRHESRGTEGMVPEDSITGERASQTAVMGTPSRDQQCAAAAGPCVGGPRDEVWACQGSLGWKETRQSARLSGSALDTRTGLCLHHQAQHQGRKAGPDRATLGDVAHPSPGSQLGAVCLGLEPTLPTSSILAVMAWCPALGQLVV